MALRLVSFDLDGTLAHPAVFNVVADALGFGEKLEETTRAYFEGRMSAEETFHADYKHFVGRRVDEMQLALAQSTRWTPGIAEAVERLHEAGVRVCVTTDQPDWLATVTQDLFGVDDVVCTAADVRHGRVTGTYSDAAMHKWPHLARHLKAWRIDPAHVAHVGNGTNDVPIFQNVGLGVAVFAMSDTVRRAARLDLGKPDSMDDVARAVLEASDPETVGR